MPLKLFHNRKKEFFPNPFPWSQHYSKPKPEKDTATKDNYRSFSLINTKILNVILGIEFKSLSKRSFIEGYIVLSGIMVADLKKKAFSLDPAQLFKALSLKCAMSSATDLPSISERQPSAIAIAYVVLVRKSIALVDSTETPSGRTSIIYPAVTSMIYCDDQHDKTSLKG